MDQNRSATNQPNQQQQQQNVHLHMHHVCNCSGSLFQTFYHPTAAAAVGYRSTLPSLLPYHAGSSSTVTTRPYLQHYQYTQFNMGNQYTLPASLNTMAAAGASSGASPNASIFGQPMSTASNTTVDLVCGRNRSGGVGGVASVGGGGTGRGSCGSVGGGGERCEEMINGNGIGVLDCGNFDVDHINPSANELLLANASDITMRDNFVKFLERSCIMAEQVAHRNRNRPCFRNIQNLCIRTRSEILKPNTTLANIHSQGLPWATKDFIYAFIRLINCWHILNGYWENKDEFSLGNINKELSPEFRACYVIWEKCTIEMAGHLSRMFYNLDCDLNTGSGASAAAATAAAASYSTTVGLVSPQVNLIKSASESAIKKSAVPSTPVMEMSSPVCSTKSMNARGLIHLPVVNNCNSNATLIPEDNTIRCDNQQQPNNVIKKDECDLEEERVYMKPGCYYVPKKGPPASEAYGMDAKIPRTIEFFETAKNVKKAMDVSTGRSEWAQKINENLDEYRERTSSPAPSPLSTALNAHRSVYLDTYDVLPELDEPNRPLSLRQSRSISLPILQREKLTELNLSDPSLSKTHTLILNENDEESNSNYNNNNLNGNYNPYENRTGGLTEVGQRVLKNVLTNLKSYFLGGDLYVKKIDFELILCKITNGDYAYLKEAIHDLKCIVKIIDNDVNHASGWFMEKLEIILMENFSPYDFNEINGDENDVIGPMKCSPIFNNNDYDEFI